MKPTFQKTCPVLEISPLLVSQMVLTPLSGLVTTLQPVAWPITYHVVILFFSFSRKLKQGARFFHHSEDQQISENRYHTGPLRESPRVDKQQSMRSHLCNRPKKHLDTLSSCLFTALPESRCPLQQPAWPAEPVRAGDHLSTPTTLNTHGPTLVSPPSQPALAHLLSSALLSRVHPPSTHPLPPHFFSLL